MFSITQDIEYIIQQQTYVIQDTLACQRVAESFTGTATGLPALSDSLDILPRLC